MNRAAVLVLVLSGCVVDPGPAPLNALDEAFFETHVQPILALSCASLDCHGVGLRPLRLYAENGLRLRDDLRGQPISDAELRWNVRAFEAIDPEPDSVDESVALTKPLAVDEGGLHHVGDPVWADRTDPGYLCLRGWLDSDPSVAGDCERARTALEPAP